MADFSKVKINDELINVKDTTARDDIAAETAAREAADAALSGDITAEASAREAADNKLTADITAETAAREAADKNYIGDNRSSSVTGDDTRTAGDITDTADNVTIHGTTSVLIDADGTLTAEGEDIVLNPSSGAITYQTPAAGGAFNHIIMKDSNNQSYNILVEKTKAVNGVINLIDAGGSPDIINNEIIKKALADNYTVYIPDGAYPVSAIDFDNEHLIGSGTLSINSHEVPINEDMSATLYASDFSDAATVLSWTRHYNSDVIINDLTYSGALEDYSNLTLNNLVSDSIITRRSHITINNVTWGTTTNVAHLLCDSGSNVTVKGTETISGSSANFHLWVRDSSCDIGSLESKLNNNKFQFFVYVEVGYLFANGYTWSGSVYETTGYACTRNSHINTGDVTGFANFNTFFPNNFSGDSYVSQPNVGSTIGNYPDYGYNYLTAATSMTNQTFIENNNLPDPFTMLVIKFDNVRTTGNVYIQLRPINESYMTAGSYQGIDTQIQGDNIYNFDLKNSASLGYFGTGSGVISGQIKISPSCGITLTQYTGFIIDGAGTKHMLNGYVNTANWIRGVRILTDSTFTQGTFSVLGVL